MKPHKFNAKRQVCGQGHNHPSKREANRCDQLTLLQRGGHITCLEYEPFYPFPINGQVIKHANGHIFGYKPDFTYIEKDKRIAEDVKSKATTTEAFVIRALLFRSIYPDIELKVLT